MRWPNFHNTHPRTQTQNRKAVNTWWQRKESALNKIFSPQRYKGQLKRFWVIWKIIESLKIYEVNANRRKMDLNFQTKPNILWSYFMDFTVLQPFFHSNFRPIAFVYNNIAFEHYSRKMQLWKRHTVKH